MLALELQGLSMNSALTLWKLATFEALWNSQACDILSFLLLLSSSLVAVSQLLSSPAFSTLGPIDAKKLAQVDPAYLLLEVA